MCSSDLGPIERDRVYHQGTVWGWWLGIWALAQARVSGDPELGLQWLDGVGDHLATAGLGREWDDATIGRLLDDLRVTHEHLGEAVVDRAAEDLAAGLTVGWFQGRFEWGPRALGFRSILADPRRAEMRDHLNEKIKFRELFRPFAPSVAAGFEHRWFDMPQGGDLATEWMLLVAPVKTDVLPATTHVDGTARVHRVTATANPQIGRAHV